MQKNEDEYEKSYREALFAPKAGANHPGPLVFSHFHPFEAPKKDAFPSRPLDRSPAKRNDRKTRPL
jgi:hypothetical protein